MIVNKFLSLFFVLNFAFKIGLLMNVSKSSGHPIEPTDYFIGAQHRPRLVIVKPENGAILDDGSLEIQLQISGYELPSSFHDSKVCIALSASITVVEECFEQTNDLVYHIGGLIPATQYSLRVAFYERGKAIAVSVRSFLCAGIQIEDAPAAPMMTISNAVQMAVQLQNRQMTQEAEKIYRKVLSENPRHQHALHLLGLVFYQKGDPSAAVPFIESALKGAEKDEGFHNSLGECYRLLGRLADAETQFHTALTLTPTFQVSKYNLALTLQQQGRWTEAVTTYAELNREVRNEDKVVQRPDDLLTEQEQQQSQLRECDLLQALGRSVDALACWTKGAALFPTHAAILNELGTALGQAGDYPAALSIFTRAAALGSSLAELNQAHILELEGYESESRVRYEDALQRVSESGLPEYHIRVRRASVLPRILPSSESALMSIRERMSMELDALLLDSSKSSSVVDNSPPLHFGFSHGYYLAFHGSINNSNGYSNAYIKSKLAQVYLRMCPALQHGYFMELPSSSSSSLSAKRKRDTSSGNQQQRLAMADSGTNNKSSSTTATTNKTKNNAAETSNTCVTAVCNTSRSMTPSTTAVRIGIVSRHIRSGHIVGELVAGLLTVLSTLTGVQVLVFHIRDDDNDDNSNTTASSLQQFDPLRLAVDSAAHSVQSLPLDLNTVAMSVRQSALDVLLYPEIGLDPVTYFLAFSHLAPVQLCWLGHPDTTGVPAIDYFLFSSDVESTTLQQAHYSETLYTMRGLGTVFLDLIAAVNNTSSTVSSQHEALLLLQQPSSSQRQCMLFRQQLIEAISAHQLLQLPRAAHLYIVASPLSALHPLFDQVLSRLLLQDRLGYIVIIDENVTRRKAWQQLFLARLAGSFSEQVRARIIFYSPVIVVTSSTSTAYSNNDINSINANISATTSTSAAVDNTISMLTALAGGHVLLDPFPTSSSLLSCLQAVSVGLPIITMPSDSVLAGRLALAVYQLLDYGFKSSSSPSSLSGTNEIIFDMSSNGVLSSRKSSGGSGSNTVSGVSSSSDSTKMNLNGGEWLVVSSVNEYVSAALSIAHKPRLRERHSTEILQRKHRLYSSALRQQAAEDWIQLLDLIAPEEKRGRISRSDLDE